MPFIAFLGCDGSGKSAFIAALISEFKSSDAKVTRGHWRPFPFVQEQVDSPLLAADDPHGQAPRGSFSSVLKLGWLGLNWWLGWWKCLRSNSRKGYLLFDRYHGDLLVDPRRYRYGGPMWLARGVCRMMPQPDLVIFLDAEPEVLLSRKQEVSKEALEHSRARYLQLAKSHKRFEVIDASRPLDEVVDEVRKKINEKILDV